MGATPQRRSTTTSMKKWVLLYFVFAPFVSSLLVCSSPLSERDGVACRRRLMSATEADKEEKPKKKSSTTNTLITTKNQTKLIKPIKPTNLTKKAPTLVNKLSNTTNSSSSKKLNPTKLVNSSVFKELNSTSKISNSTKIGSLSTKKSSDLSKSSPPMNKISSITTKDPKNENPKKSESPSPKKESQKPQIKKIQQKHDSSSDDDDDDDFVSDFRDFHNKIVPDLERISRTSKVYITKANKEMIQGFRPLVGKEYAPSIASLTSCCIFILAPLLLVSLFFNKIKAFFSLQKLIIFIQAYLSIYFSILCLASLVTGLEPLKFFYATSRSSYVWLQVLQTLGYVMYLLLLLMYLVLVFSTDTDPGSRLVGLAQTFVGFAVGFHYYVKVFHRAVLHQPPKTNWKAHGVYATCFLGICVLARFDWTKKSYLEEGGEEGKKN
ncbi:hypothetical protein Scep_001777 [Stephania cephalantha]|uniref:Uncharacterized protein n=1 Tax=Stephania cephalantha TaxID=152367 RepID=A0AAP0Q836_9MAGN